MDLGLNHISVTGNRDEVDAVGDLIANLDRTDRSREFRVVRLRETPMEQVEKIINRLFGSLAEKPIFERGRANRLLVHATDPQFARVKRLVDHLDELTHARFQDRKSATAEVVRQTFLNDQLDITVSEKAGLVLRGQSDLVHQANDLAAVLEAFYLEFGPSAEIASRILDAATRTGIGATTDEIQLHKKKYLEELGFNESEHEHVIKQHLGVSLEQYAQRWIKPRLLLKRFLSAFVSSQADVPDTITNHQKRNALLRLDQRLSIPANHDARENSARDEFALVDGSVSKDLAILRGLTEPIVWSNSNQGIRLGVRFGSVSNSVPTVSPGESLGVDVFVQNQNKVAARVGFEPIDATRNCLVVMTDQGDIVAENRKHARFKSNPWRLSANLRTLEPGELRFLNPFPWCSVHGNQSGIARVEDIAKINLVEDNPRSAWATPEFNLAPGRYSVLARLVIYSGSKRFEIEAGPLSFKVAESAD